jgi:hypothetical protein
MRISPHHAFAFLAVQALGLSVSACSSSTPLKRPTDAAADARLVFDLSRESAPVGNDAVSGDRSPSGDLLAADAPPPEDLVAADLPLIKDTAASDPLASKDATTPDAFANKDTPAPDDPGTKDAPEDDLYVPQDGTKADFPISADLVSLDGSGRDGTPPMDVTHDGSSDLRTGCLAAIFPECNDNPISEAVMGICQADGTCKCNSGYVLNPSTGRCGYPRQDGSPGDTGAMANLCTGTYDACDCSCCGPIGRDMMCYFPTLGESVATLTAAEEARKTTIICGSGACSSGIHYLCCTPVDPEPSSGATYAASGYSGGYDHLSISKTGADCASLGLIGAASATAGFHIDATKPWVGLSASFGPCADAGAQTQARGAVGTLALRMSGGTCVMDLHATLFAISDSAVLTTTRMDGEGIPFPSGLPSGYCN